jgi:hypothetical protein
VLASDKTMKTVGVISRSCSDMSKGIATVGAVTAKAQEQSSSPCPARRLDNGACARGAAGTIGYARPVLLRCKGTMQDPLSGCQWSYSSAHDDIASLKQSHRI